MPNKGLTVTRKRQRSFSAKYNQRYIHSQETQNYIPHCEICSDGLIDPETTHARRCFWEEFASLPASILNSHTIDVRNIIPRGLSAASKNVCKTRAG
jgi:hypothetical protein